VSEKPRKPLAELLRELDAELERDPMPIGVRNRIELRIREHERPSGGRWRRWLPACTFAAGAALVLAVIGLRLPSESVQMDEHAAVAASPSHVQEAAPMLGAFALSGDACESRPAGSGAEMRGDCRLVSGRMTVQVWEHAIVEPEGEAVRLRSGQALFDVEPGDPVRIEVSHGAIEVLGTRFAVAQDGAGGHVDLFEGEIRFHGTDGRVLDIRPGQRHSWGSSAVEVAQAEIGDDTIEVLADDKPQGRRKSRAAARDDLLERVEALRAERRYREAISVLRDASRRSWSPRTAQLLSYELAELLRFEGDRDAACEHLRGHQRRFPDGIYDDAILRWLDKLDCE
jgi:transmembrane sensor